MLDVDAALEHLARGPSVEGVHPRARPEGLPPHELTRSPAAEAVGLLAARDGLLLAHFEHRAPVLAEEEPVWVGGVLPESKYGSFWHELPIGSFHPGHRAKWGAHELCHALIGAAWWPGASPLELATAGRLAELVPVVLWYFLDEVGLRRCPRHGEPLFRTFCPDCEAAARRGPRAVDASAEHPADRGWVELADRYLERELAAVARTRRLGRTVHHVWGSLDLASDGLAYIAHHRARLESPAFRRWAERFFRPSHAGHSSLEALEHRVVEVVRGIAEGAPVAPWVGDPEEGRRRWVAMDLAARLSMVADAVEGAAHAAIVQVMDDLADGADPTLAAAAYDGPVPAEEVFAVGYTVPGLPSRSVARVADGLATVVPLTLELFDDAGLDPVPAFVADDVPVRRPLGDRFAAWLAALQPGPAAELARYEALLRGGTPDGESRALGLEGAEAPEGAESAALRLVPGAKVAELAFDPVPFAEAVEAGEVEGRAENGQLVVEAPDPAPTTLVCAIDAQGELILVDLPGGSAPALREPERLPEEVRASLVELGLLVPTGWPIG